MKKILIISLLGFLIGLLFSNIAKACTAILVTKDASQSHSVIVSHSEDNDFGDQRIMYVPSRNYKTGTKRPIYPYEQYYPRYVGTSRGKAYDIPNYKPTKPLGYIKQVKHTYSYIDAGYAVINKKQLSFGESSTEAKSILTYTEPQIGKRIFDIAALSRVAAERCSTAKQAIKLMGHLAEKYGYYGVGEALLIGDKQEGWLFEITSTPDGKSALWAAKKIPNGEITVVANEFRIRTIDPKDPNIMYSNDLFRIAQDYKLSDLKKGKLDWLETVSDGEYNHPYYSLRRVWRVYSLLNPNLHLNPWVKNGYTNEYPFSVKPTRKVAIRDIINIYRDHYEGTSFDLTKGVAAGAFGSPDRYFGLYDLRSNLKEAYIPGAWERPISAYDNGFTTICQSRSNLPDFIGGRVWIAVDRADLSVFLPFYVTNMPNSYEYVDSNRFDPKAAWWTFNFVSNWAKLKYSYMKPEITKEQKRIEDQIMESVKTQEQDVLKISSRDPKKARHVLTLFTFETVNKTLKEWWVLAYQLIAKYNEGYVSAKRVGYAKVWLKKVGYYKGPVSYVRKR